MRLWKSFTVIAAMLVALPFSGCGGSGSSGAGDPLGKAGTTGNPAPQVPAGPGAVTTYTMTLQTVGSSGSTTVGLNSTVIATATLKDNLGNPIASQPIKFEEVIPPPETTGAVTIDSPIVNTTSGGTAIDFIRTSLVDQNKDVIIRASTSVNGQLISAISTFKIARTAGNYIDFITTKNITDPSGNLNELTVSVKQSTLPAMSILQLVTFRVLDINGVPRANVPVQLSIYGVVGNCQNGVFIDSPEPTTRTVTTDNTGLGVFGASVTLPMPPIGTQNSCSVIYKATTPDPYSAQGKDLFSYGAYMATLINTF